MNIRDAATTHLGRPAADALGRLNDRHPWSHNDAYHPWIATQLPEGRGRVLDVGCGHGELLAMLAGHFDQVHGVDADETMRAAAAARCAGLPNVTVDATELSAVGDGYADLVTMIAVLHHLEIHTALAQVRRILRPGGRFLSVGLARPESAVDQAWEVASMVTNPLIGYLRHPWPAAEAPDRAPFPVADPQLSIAEMRDALEVELPGGVLRRGLGFRHTIAWTKPHA
ncbi:class I SAM-dependent methyltransferase [Flexivirga sp. B27]